ncbi:hypothetical protein K7432_006480 [Basidiobolus ranarum]|uniref:Uncharacterized protein n=1 Tax=Basidiobolus ranarum TaxID=34480 RepID=A0ABR2W1I9_9FUNG
MALQDHINLWSRNDRYVRDCFIALWALWMIWSLLQLAKYFITWNDRALTHATSAPVMRERVGSSESAHVAVEGQTASSAVSTVTPKLTPFSERIARAEALARGLFITFLWVLIASTVGYGITRGSMIIAWLYFAVALIWICVELAISHSISRVSFGIVEFAFGLAIMGIAFQFGW